MIHLGEFGIPMELGKANKSMPKWNLAVSQGQ